MIRQFVLLLITVSVIACGESTRSPSEAAVPIANTNITYDPSSCKTDAEGMVYFALGREVFRRPFQGSMSIGGMLAEERAALPPPPDPSEPEGCPGNPVWGRSFSIDYEHLPADPNAYRQQTPFRASINFIALRESDWDSVYDAATWGNQLSYERDFDRRKHDYDSCETLPSGLIDCRVPESDRTREFWSATFQAEPDIYSAPFGRPFTVSCLTWPVVARQDCNVSYNYTRSTRIAYHFDLNDLPPAEFISFDRGLREKIESMRVRDYRWKDE
jgi:hypothetical protein